MFGGLLPKPIKHKSIDYDEIITEGVVLQSPYKERLSAEDEMDESEQEIAKQYLEKYGGLRRHTIGTNPASNKNDQNRNNYAGIETFSKNNLLNDYGDESTMQQMNSSVILLNYLLNQNESQDQNTFPNKLLIPPVVSSSGK